MHSPAPRGWLGQFVLAKRFEPFDIGKDYALGWREEPSGALLYDLRKDAAQETH